MAASHNAYTLGEPRVQAVLTRLYDAVKKERFQRVGLGGRLIMNRLRGRTWSLEEYVHHVKDMYVPLSRERGEFAYSAQNSILIK